VIDIPVTTSRLIADFIIKEYLAIINSKLEFTIYLKPAFRVLPVLELNIPSSLKICIIYNLVCGICTDSRALRRLQSLPSVHFIGLPGRALQILHPLEGLILMIAIEFDG
jgi:hypothetical protein